MSLRALEFYSGIGGLHLALSRADPKSTVVQAFDWDQTACRVYDANHGAGVAKKTDISTLTASDLASYNADIWLLSPACQPYTVLNPDAKGAQDPRAQSYLHLLQNVLPELAQSSRHPSYILVENVAGFEGSTTRQIQLGVLRSLGYHIREVLLSPLQFGIPNSRLRYYLLARRAPFPDQPETEQGDGVWRHIPDRRPDCLPEEVRPLREYLHEETPDCTVPDKVLQKWGRLFDIVLPSGRRSCCFTRGYTHLVERSGSILQEAEDLDTTETFDAFLAAQTNNTTSAVEILHPLRLRYFSPSELIRIFNFERTREDTGFVWPPGVSNKSKYKLIGNSVNVRVVEELVRYLLM